MKKEYVKGYKDYDEFKKGYEEYKQKLEQIVGKPLIYFIREYEIYKEGIKHTFGYGILYKVRIKLSDEGRKAGLMEELMEEPGFIRIDDDDTLLILWEVPYDGVGELENIMYYVLKAGEYGSFKILECVYADYSELYL